MNIEIENQLCARNARACIHARVYALAQGSLPPPPCPVVSQNSSFRKITRGVFPKSSLVFDDTPQVSKFASFSSNLFGTLWLKILIFVIRNTLLFYLLVWAIVAGRLFGHDHSKKSSTFSLQPIPTTLY